MAGDYSEASAGPRGHRLAQVIITRTPWFSITRSTRDRPALISAGYGWVEGPNRLLIFLWAESRRSSRLAPLPQSGNEANALLHMIK